MKKLSLNAIAFQKGEVLTRSQLKKVLGGNGSGSGTTAGKCYYTCSYELNGNAQVVHSWGAACTSNSDCSTNTTCSSYGIPWASSVYCAAV